MSVPGTGRLEYPSPILHPPFRLLVVNSLFTFQQESLTRCLSSIRLPGVTVSHALPTGSVRTPACGPDSRRTPFLGRPRPPSGKISLWSFTFTDNLFYPGHVGRVRWKRPVDKRRSGTPIPPTQGRPGARNGSQPDGRTHGRKGGRKE